MGSGTGIPSELLAGPYGFVVVIALCLFWGLREWRKGREQDVLTYKKRAEDADQERQTAESKSEQDSRVLEARIDALTSDLRALRETNYRDNEMTLSKYYACRQMLVSLGVKPEDIP